ncbi:voltage-gated potassium channel subunit beta-2-like isoform X2 [Paramacrobiotus metropolitanus]|nr:voltage-gated potassium channel subunit beta-2-like isoform X2 [Paramacrobiotus metropolitanus]
MLEKQSMQYRSLGNSGLRISRISLGMGPGLGLALQYAQMQSLQTGTLAPVVPRSSSSTITMPGNAPGGANMIGLQLQLSQPQSPSNTSTGVSLVNAISQSNLVPSSATPLTTTTITVAAPTPPAPASKHCTAAAEEIVEQIVSLAYECGVNYFDAADSQTNGTPGVPTALPVGRTETLLGKVLKKKKWRRSSYVITTKICRTGTAETEKGLSRKHVVESLQASLERLGLAYVDVVFACCRDNCTPMEEIVRAFSWVIEKGWAFYWATANWSQAEIMEAYTVAKVLNLTPPLADQCEYNVFRREPVELVIPELLCGIGCGSITYSPLANGLIVGDYEMDDNTSSSLAMQRWALLERDTSIIERERRNSEVTLHLHKIKYLRPIADQIGCSLSQLAIAWCLRTELVQSVLISPSSLEQLRDHLLALSVLDKLTPEVLAVMEKVLGNQPSLGLAKNKNATKPGQQDKRRRSSIHRKSVTSSPRLSISHAGNPYEGRIGYRESIDYSYDRRPSHI